MFHVKQPGRELAVAMRHLRLETLARLRRSGWLPWSLLLAWSLAALAQEPRMLRLLGVEVGPQATWVAAAMLLPLLITPCRISGVGDWLAERLLQVALVWGLGGVQALAVALGELALHGRTNPADAFASAAMFGICWTPFAITVRRNPGESPFARWCGCAMVWGCVVFGVLAGRPLWQHGCDGQLAAALLLVTAGVTIGTWRSTPSNHQKCA